MTRSKAPRSSRLDINMKDLYVIVGLTKEGPLMDEQREKLVLALQALAKRAGLERTRRNTEKSRNLPNGKGKPGDDAGAAPEDPAKPSEKPPACGHGRNGADAYGGATRCYVPHESLKAGDVCPACKKGKLYDLPVPSVTVRITGQAPLGAEITERQRLRCNTCSMVFTAAAPEGLGQEKYDAAASAMIGLLRYGSGMPFNRLERLQGNLGIPLPASTQWTIAEEAAKQLTPVFEELIRQAAQGEVVYNDDTKMRVIALDDPEYRKKHGSPSGRTGTFTSGIVSTRDGRTIVLYLTGWKHAGENFKDVLVLRDAGLPLPIQMCDGLSHNVSPELATIHANCLPHSRRKFVEVVDVFPEECRIVILAVRDVYRNDDLAKERGMSKEERLLFHQTESGPVMARLHTWLKEQLDQKIVEPNSSLGEAMRYMLKHWEKLTLFLRVAGAPLDNNITERALKRAIQHRKNSLFYKTLNGARVGDIFQSLIHTAEHARVNPLEYLTALLRHASDVARQPDRWMPWNYKQAAAEAAR